MSLLWIQASSFSFLFVSLSVFIPTHSLIGLSVLLAHPRVLPHTGSTFTYTHTHVILNARFNKSCQDSLVYARASVVPHARTHTKTEMDSTPFLVGAVYTGVAPSAEDASTLLLLQLLLLHMALIPDDDDKLRRRRMVMTTPTKINAMAPKTTATMDPVVIPP